MHYQGGKSRIAKDISAIINESANLIGGGCRDSGKCFVSLFCGGCSIESKIRGFGRIICNDINEYLIELLKAVQNGYELPDSVTKEEYDYIRNHKDEDKALTGFVGIAASFGGKWFAGYAKNKRGQNYAQGGKLTLLQYMQSLKYAEFICHDYREVELPVDCVIYSDPPYNNTTGYLKEKFDSNSFWEYMREISGKGYLAFISEQNAPDDFIPIWQKELRRNLDSNKDNNFMATEKLFVYKDFAEKLNLKREL